MSEATCPRCGGVGFIVREHASGITSAEPCDCTDYMRQRGLEHRANIPKGYENASLDNFLLPVNNPIRPNQPAHAVLLVRNYVNVFPQLPQPGLLFIGPPGTGKTHLAIAALRGLLARGFEGIFFNFLSLLDHIKAGWNDESGTMDRAAYGLAMDSPILVLDDLGAHRMKDFVEDTVTAIITHRCNNRLATIITTNLRDVNAGGKPPGASLEARLNSKYYLTEHIGERSRSRLFEMCRLIRMDGEDYRQTMAGSHRLPDTNPNSSNGSEHTAGSERTQVERPIGRRLRENR